MSVVKPSFCNETFHEKLRIYRGQDFYTASLSDAVCAHQPPFHRFVEERELPLQVLAAFGQVEHDQQSELAEKLNRAFWSPNRPKGVAL